MKRKILTKIISMLLTIAMLVGTLQLTLITAFATGDGINQKTTTASVAQPTELSGADIIKQELAERTPIVKSRTGIKSTSEAAVYKDGVLFDQGGFSSMWNVAMDLASDVTGDRANDGNKSRNVEYVLNMDFEYDESWFSEGTMTISNKYFTIDLNGHMILRDDHGSVVAIIDQSVVTIMDSNPSRAIPGYIFEERYWRPYGDCSVPLYGGVICGGYLKVDDGGGIMVDGGSTLTLTGGNIAGNKADIGSGIYIGEGCTVDMSRGTAEVCYNYSAGTSSDGGAIFLRPGATVIGGYVHDNNADDYGGGVRAKGDDILVKDVIIASNKAEEDGGGMYVEGGAVNITGCKIVGNHSGEQGGGVHLCGSGKANISDTLIVDNTSIDEGAGIFLDKTLYISGKMVVRDNDQTLDKESIKSNLYVEDASDLFVEKMSLGSEIWVRTYEAATDGKLLSNNATNSSHLFFFSDEADYCIKYQDDPAKSNYRKLYFAKGTRIDDNIAALADPTPKEQSNPYKVTSGQYKGETMPLYKGYFEYSLMTSSDFTSLSPFYYSDGYFLEDPTVYNTHLASMSIAAAMAAFGRSTDQVGDNAYANHFANIKQLFSDIGCADVNFFVNEDYQMQPHYYGTEGRLSTIGVAISKKDINVNGETYTLVPVAIRGADYGSEWGSNVSIGASGEAQGFSDAANQVFAHIQSYIENYGLAEQAANGKLKFWVVGYSRAGATANLTSKRLVDNYAEGGNQVYGYTFEAPKGGVEEAKNEKDYTGNGTYPTIHNTINELDFVTLVAPGEMGFIRYGVEHLIGSETESGNKISYDTNSAYYQQRQKMIVQLNATDPYYKFYDGWEVADINIVLSQIPGIGTNLIDTGEQLHDNPNAESKSMYTFLRWFFARVQGDGLLLDTKEIAPDPSKPDEKETVTDFSKSREYFSVKKPLASIEGNVNSPNNYAYSEMTLQEALTSMMYLLMESFTPEQQSQLIDYLSGTASDLLGGLGIKFWDQEQFEDYMDINYALSAVASIAVSFGSSFSYTIGVYKDLIYSWDERSEKENAETLDWLMHKIITHDLSNILNDEQEEMLTEALPVVLWFALNYASYDYEQHGFLHLKDDGMWGVGTFINNASTIISYHYPEVNAAWVRSYDSYYENDTQAYTLDTSKVVYDEPVGLYIPSTKKLNISGENGSSLFYSVDGGNTWKLYSKEVTLEQTPEKILCFSIYRGVKSEVKEVPTNPLTGSLLGGGKIWFLLIGSAFIVGMSVVGIEISRKKKKEEAENN